ncbi:MAG: YdcF family protein [Planctomycetota bacterium]
MWRVYLTPFLLPPLSLFALALLGLVLRRWWPRCGRLLVGAAALLLLCASLPVTGALLLGSLEVAPPLMPPLPAADAVVILGGDLRDGAQEYGGETLGKLTLERVRYGAALARRTRAPVCVSGGVIQTGKRPLAELMRAALADELSVAVRFIEDRSRTTTENAERCRDLLVPHGVQRIYLVTHAWHMRRAVKNFAACGFEVVPAPTMAQPALDLRLTDFLPTARALEASAFAVHEWLGLLWFALTR